MLVREEANTQLIFQERIDPIERAARTAPGDLDAVVANHDPEGFLTEVFGLLSAALPMKTAESRGVLVVMISIRLPVA